MTLHRRAFSWGLGFTVNPLYVAVDFGPYVLTFRRPQSYLL